MTKRSGSRQLQKIGEILERVLKKNGIQVPAEESRLREIWNRTVGCMIAAQTCPDRVRRGTLFVKVSTSIWMHQLQFLKDDILERLKNQWEEEPIERVHFSVGHVGSPVMTETGEEFFHPTARLLKKRDKTMIEESLDAVKDPELQGILRRAMIKELSRRRYLEHHGKIS